MGQIKQRRRFNPITIEFGVSLTIGLAASLFLLASEMIYSDWTRPNGICDFVEGTGGLLPLNPNAGGTVVYSCDPDLALLFWHLFIPAAVVASVLFLVIRFARDLFDI